MLNKPVSAYIIDRLHYVENEFLLMGIVFFVLASAIIMFPQLIQVLFIIGFFLISFSTLFISIKLSHIRTTVSKALGIKKSR